MKRWVVTILLLPASCLFAKDKKLGGYVINAAAFGKIQSYCVDTHNLPPDEADIINHFVHDESRPNGLLSKLPWRRLPTCQSTGADAVIRIEFPRSRVPMVFMLDSDVNGALMVFCPGSPSPIYETRELQMVGEPGTDEGRFGEQCLERDALNFVVRMLIHDWQTFSETYRAAS